MWAVYQVTARVHAYDRSVSESACWHRLILERDREALAEADAAEWQARRAEIEKQAEEARREKQRRRAQAEREGERARRSQVSLTLLLCTCHEIPMIKLDSASP